VQYFEVQRGLVVTSLRDGSVDTRFLEPTVPGARAKASTRARATARPSRRGQFTYFPAFKAKEKLVPPFAATAGLSVWRELGPSSIPKGQTYGAGGNNQPPVSGRCVGIFVDPANSKHLVLCTAGGGLWGSSDTGATWRPLTDFQPTLSMGAIAAAPSSPNIVYSGTGEGDTRSPLGMGLLRSSDGGLTWTLVPSPALAGTGIYDIAVDPQDPLHLWVGAVQGLLESRDGGATFVNIRTGLTWDISIHPAAPKEILVGSDLGLLRSANGGTNWSSVALPGGPASGRYARMEVCHAPSDPGVVMVAAATGSKSFFWRRAASTSAFATEAPPPGLKVTQAWYDWCLAVSPSDKDTVYWGAIELYRGRRASNAWTWENISSRKIGDSIHPDQHHLAFDPNDPRVLYACNDGGLFRSPDGGTSWASLNPGLAITEFEFLAHLESQNAWVIGGTQDNGTLSDSGAGTWDQVALGDGGDCGAAENGDALCFHSYFDMWIERAPALGPNAFQWTDVSPPFPKGYQALFYPPMDARGATIAKAGQSVFVSGDSGMNWDEVLLPTSGDQEPDVASALTIANANTLLVGTVAGNLYRITRSAGGWSSAQVLGLKSPRAGFVSDIVVPGSPTKVVWVSCSEVGGGHVFRSSNGGSTWTNRTGNLPDIPVNAIVVDPKQAKRVFAATDNGVYRTQDAGLLWTDFSNGLPNAVIGDLILHERQRLLRAGTRNRGAWEVAI
jgi:hypothetical protein